MIKDTKHLTKCVSPLIIIFTLWILPLGSFVSPQKDKQLCNGRRPICMCRHRMAKKSTENNTNLRIPAIQPNSSNAKKGLTHNDFLSQHIFFPIKLSAHRQSMTIYLIPQTLLIKTIEHVPKITFS